MTKMSNINIKNSNNVWDEDRASSLLTLRKLIILKKQHRLAIDGLFHRDEQPPHDLLLFEAYEKSPVRRIILKYGNDYELVSYAARSFGIWTQFILQDIGPILRGNKKFIMKMDSLLFDYESIEYIPSLGYASDSLRGDEKFVMYFVKNNAMATLPYISRELLEEEEFRKEFILNACEPTNCRVLQYVPDQSWFRDTNFMKRLFELGSYGSTDLENIFEYLPVAIRDDPHVMMLAMKETYGHCFPYVSDNLRNNDAFMQGLIEFKVTSAETVLEYGSDRLQSDRNFVLKMIEKCGSAIQSASPDLQHDRQIFTAAISSFGYALQYIPHLTFEVDIGLVLTAVGNSGLALEYAPDKYKNNIQVVSKAVENNGKAIEFASPDLQNDENLAIVAVKNNGCALEYVSPNLKQNKKVVLEAVRNDHEAIKFAAPSLQQDKKVVLEAVRSNHEAIKFASPSLQQDIDILVSSYLRELKLPPTNILLDKQKTPLTSLPKIFDMVYYADRRRCYETYLQWWWASEHTESVDDMNGIQEEQENEYMYTIINYILNRRKDELIPVL